MPYDITNIRVYAEGADQHVLRADHGQKQDAAVITVIAFQGHPENGGPVAGDTYTIGYTHNGHNLNENRMNFVSEAMGNYTFRR